MFLILTVAALQIRRQLRRRQVIGSIAVLTVLAALSTVLGLRTLSAQEARYNQLLQQTVRDQARTGPSMGWQIEPALRVIRPLDSATAIVRGVQATAAAYWDFGPGGVVASPAAPVHDADEISPTLDLEFIVRVLLGLVALTVGTNGLSMLRPGGELIGISRLPISQPAVWAGQALGSMIVVLVSWTVVAAGAVAAAFVTSDVGPATEVLRAIGRLAIPATAYLSFMVGLGAMIAVLINAQLHRTFAVLVGWLVLANLAPTTLLSIARIARPVSSSLTMVTARDSAFAVEIRAAEIEMGDTLARRTETDRPTSNPFKSSQYPEIEAIWLRRAHSAREQARLIEDGWRQQEMAHDIWLRRVEWLSPASLFWRSATDAVGTGRAERAAWDRAVREYSEQLRASLFDDRPRAVVSLPADGGRQALAMDRHQPIPVRNLVHFDSRSIETTGRSGVGAATNLLFGYATMLLLLSIVLFVRRQN